MSHLTDFQLLQVMCRWLGWSPPVVCEGGVIEVDGWFEGEADPVTWVFKDARGG